MPIFRSKQYVLRVGLFFFCLITFFPASGCGGVQENSLLFRQEETGQEEGSKAAIPTADSEREELVQKENMSREETVLPANCVIHICGAVRNPGVYELPDGSRIMDAVRAGGGFLPEADPSACNLAARIADGCQIYIMTQEESSRTQVLPEAGIQPGNTGMAVTGNGGQPEDDGKVNLNTADAKALKMLPGIGDSRAAAIIAWREENGQFDRIEDIMKVSGIKQAAFEKIKDIIRV